LLDVLQDALLYANANRDTAIFSGTRRCVAFRDVSGIDRRRMKRFPG
jgi:hypothetical protein